ncbi:hypothetical protein ABIE78_000788 [Sinorhizobium fredii]|uniref:hypothetical protein n=1 Tax=Rhizobium fredii TaxID=380 RepID=UPI00065E9E71|nr:hypothetical protein [Sinorhizobium fredii]
MRIRKAVLFSITALFAATVGAKAADFEMLLFGHRVIVLGSDTEQLLEVDGRQVLKEAIIDIDEVHLISGTPVVIGSASPGGNACEGAPFIISFPPNAAPRIDGPLDTCFVVTTHATPTQLSFSTTAMPNRPGERWMWSLEGGLKRVEGQTFSADTSKGWAQLREKTASHPGDLLKFGEIAEQIDALLGADKASFKDIIMGVGSGEFDGDYFAGSACTPHMCFEQEAILIASITEQKVYLAWKPSGEKIIVRPVVKDWPEKAKVFLRNWASKWK